MNFLKPEGLILIPLFVKSKFCEPKIKRTDGGDYILFANPLTVFVLVVAAVFLISFITLFSLNTLFILFLTYI